MLTIRDQSRRLPGSLQNIELDILLDGLTPSAGKSSHELFCPQVRRSPPKNGHSRELVDHLDTISIWRQLDVRQADELFLWEKVFKTALETYIHSRIQERFCESSQFGHGEAVRIICAPWFVMTE